MRIFITGGTGYVGSAVTRILAAAGHDVVGLVRTPEKGKLLSQLGGTPLIGNLREPHSYTPIAADCDAIIHLAAETGPERQKIERGAVRSLLEALHVRTEPRSFLYTSVLFILGNTGTVSATEDSRLQPTPYTTERVEYERLILEAADASLSTAVVRPGMVYGGGEGGAVSELFQSAVQEGAATYVGDGKNRWSLVHRDDVASLYRIILEQRGRGIFHAVDGFPLPVSEIARHASQAAGRDGLTRSLPLEQAREFLGTFADALCLDQVVHAPRAQAIGWEPKWPAFPEAAKAAFAEWEAASGQ